MVKYSRQPAEPTKCMINYSFLEHSNSCLVFYSR